ncbi:MAG: FtsX-like permease family protein [Holophagales bacterium]|nr:FtsX-like permease family protein [Holophagales bacterium]
MPLQLAWRDLLHHRGRTAATGAGVFFAILLIFMQLGFYVACRESAVRVHRLLDYDLLLVSSRYIFIMQADPFPEERVRQAAAVPGVAEALRVRVAADLWRNPQTGNRHDAFVLGVDPDDHPSVLPGLNRQISALGRLGTALFDLDAHPILGANPAGTRSEMAGRQVEVVGSFRWGAGFAAHALVMVGRRTFDSVFRGHPPDAVELGLLRLEPGASAPAVAAELHKRLPPDVRAFTREAIQASDRAFFLRDRPIGLMFTSGVVVAFLVGSMILFQVLSSEVSRRLHELATLKALGFRPLQIYGVVVQKGLLYTLVAFLPAAGASALLYAGVRELARLPLHMTPTLLLAVLGVSLFMSLAGALAASRRIRLADPAELF